MLATLPQALLAAESLCSWAEALAVPPPPPLGGGEQCSLAETAAASAEEAAAVDESARLFEESALLLESARLLHSSSYPFVLRLISLYERLGAFEAGIRLYNSLEIKQVTGSLLSTVAHIEPPTPRPQPQAVADTHTTPFAANSGGGVSSCVSKPFDAPL